MRFGGELVDQPSWQRATASFPSENGVGRDEPSRPPPRLQARGASPSPGRRARPSFPRPPVLHARGTIAAVLARG